jgi:hypothetical protein
MLPEALDCFPLLIPDPRQLDRPLLHGLGVPVTWNQGVVLRGCPYWIVNDTDSVMLSYALLRPNRLVYTLADLSNARFRRRMVTAFVDVSTSKSDPLFVELSSPEAGYARGHFLAGDPDLRNFPVASRPLISMERLLAEPHPIDGLREKIRSLKANQPPSRTESYLQAASRHRRLNYSESGGGVSTVSCQHQFGFEFLATECPDSVCAQDMDVLAKWVEERATQLKLLLQDATLTTKLTDVPFSPDLPHCAFCGDTCSWAWAESDTRLCFCTDCAATVQDAEFAEARGRGPLHYMLRLRLRVNARPRTVYHRINPDDLLGIRDVLIGYGALHVSHQGFIDCVGLASLDEWHNQQMLWSSHYKALVVRLGRGAYQIPVGPRERPAALNPRRCLDIARRHEQHYNGTRSAYWGGDLARALSAGTAAPRATGTAASPDAGTAAPSDAGTAAPSDAGTAASADSWTAASPDAGTAAPADAGTAAHPDAGTAAAAFHNTATSGMCFTWTQTTRFATFVITQSLTPRQDAQLIDSTIELSLFRRYTLYETN